MYEHLIYAAHDVYNVPLFLSVFILKIDRAVFDIESDVAYLGAMTWFLWLSLFASVASADIRYCVACEAMHDCSRWHFASGIPMCHPKYMQWCREGLPGPPHPGQMVLYKHRYAVDVTSRRIVALKHRVDTVAFREAYTLQRGRSG